MKSYSVFVKGISVDMEQSRGRDFYIEQFLVFCLSVLCISIFFKPAYDKNLFFYSSIASLIVLLVWRFIIKYKPLNPLPKSLFIVSLLFLFFVSISAFMSDNQRLAFIFLKQYRFYILGGLLYSAPLHDKSRKHVIVVFFTSAAVLGLIGIVQYFSFMHQSGYRPDGFTDNSGIYSETQAIACGAALIILLLQKRDIFTSQKDSFFLIIVVFFTLCGVILSQARSIWIAFFIATTLLFILHDRRKALVLLFVFAAFFSVIFFTSTVLKQRALSITTSVYTENESGSTGTRIELWKGALLIFREHPILGVGLGDFPFAIHKLVLDKKIKKTPFKNHAHNTYLHTAATRGIIGLMLLAALFISLIRWGMKRIRDRGAVGGYIILFITLLSMIGGLTDHHIESTMFLISSCLVIGLLGPCGAKREKALGAS